MRIQAFGAEPANKRLNLGIIDSDRLWLTGLSAGTIQRRYNILALVTEPRIQDRDISRERINHRQNADLAPRRKLIMHKVHCPYIIGANCIFSVFS